jgi:hypothetical protein
VLTRLQINQCLIDIEAMQPLLYTASKDDILPVLKYFSYFQKKPDFKQELRSTLMAEMKLKMSKSQK